MCLDMEMIHLYEYFVLHGTILLSSYWTQATNDNNKEFDSPDNTRKKGAFAKIMKTYKNKVISGENAVNAGDVFCSFLWCAFKNPNDMKPKAFKALFDVVMNLFEDLEDDFELTIGKRERRLIFFNAFSAVHQNKIVAQQKVCRIFH